MKVLKATIVGIAGGLAAALLVCSAAAEEVAEEKCATPRTLVEVLGKGEISTYDEKGEFLGRISRSSIVTGVEVLGCNDKLPKRVKVQVKDKDAVWVDLLQVRVTGGGERKVRVCKDTALSARNDETAPAVTGLDPCFSNK